MQPAAAPSASRPAIVVDKVELSLGRGASRVHILKGLSLTIAQGQSVGLVGPSGSGKSTTGRIVLGLEPPDRGEVRFQGKPMAAPGTAAWRAQRARMQMIFQDPLGALDRRLPVATQIREPLDIHDLGTQAEREDRVRELLRQVAVARAGARRRVLLAAAVAGIWSSHPPTAERIDATRRPSTGKPAFTDAEWKAIRNVCK